MPLQNVDLQRLQGLMVYLASSANGLELLLGRGAPSITFRAGRTTGLKAKVQQQERSDLLKALAALDAEYKRLNVEWPFEVYKKKADASPIYQEDGKTKVKLVFRHCMVRSSLFRYGHPQKLSLCMMNHGLFCGLLEQIYGQKADLEIIHAGENACLKVLTLSPK